MSVWKKALSNISQRNLRSRAVSRVSPLFGESLSLVVAPSGLPLVIDDTLGFLKRKGMATEGIFRVPATATKLNWLKKMYDSGDFLKDADFADPHTAAGLLKLYLIELAEPIMTYKYYKDWISCAKLEPSERLERIIEVVDQLPHINALTLSNLCAFLYEIAQKEKETRMGVDNLALIFAPSLLRKRDENAFEMLTTAKERHAILKTIIEQHKDVFQKFTSNSENPVPMPLLESDSETEDVNLALNSPKSVDKGKKKRRQSKGKRIAEPKKITNSGRQKTSNRLVKDAFVRVKDQRTFESYSSDSDMDDDWQDISDDCDEKENASNARYNSVLKYPKWPENTKFMLPMSDVH